MRNVRHVARKPALLLLGLALASLSPGCKVTGYSIRPPYDTRVKTVYVPVFKSVTFRRDINIMLTEMVQKEIERRTPYKVVGNPDGADTTLEGTVNFSDKNIILPNPFNLPRQLTATMIVQATWTDNKAEEKKAPNPAFIAETFNFYPEIGESAQTAYARTCEKLAIQIVNMMEEPLVIARVVTEDSWVAVLPLRRPGRDPAGWAPPVPSARPPSASPECWVQAQPTGAADLAGRSSPQESPGTPIARSGENPV